jgi:hypothetical protein
MRTLFGPCPIFPPSFKTKLEKQSYRYIMPSLSRHGAFINFVPQRMMPPTAYPQHSTSGKSKVTFLYSEYPLFKLFVTCLETSSSLIFTPCSLPHSPLYLLPLLTPLLYLRGPRALRHPPCSTRLSRNHFFLHSSLAWYEKGVHT